jgi:hypothetical protein
VPTGTGQLVTTNHARPHSRRAPVERRPWPWLLGGALVLTVGLVAGAMVSCRGQGTAGDNNVIRTPEAGRGSNGPLALKDYDGAVIGGGFRDGQRGAIVRAVCSTSKCGYQAASTGDGGVTWSVHTIPVPAPSFNPTDDANAAVLPGGQIVVDLQIQPGKQGLISADGGGVWSDRMPQPIGATTRIPPTAALVGSCPQVASCTEPVLRVIGANGTSSPYGPPPAGLVETIDAGRLADGSIRVYGRDISGRVITLLSRDQGRSWVVTPVDTTAGGMVTIAGIQANVWVQQVIDGPDGKGRLQSLMRSADGGRTFVSVPLPTAYTANDGGTVGVTTSGAALVSTTGGRVAIIGVGGDVSAVPQVRGTVRDLGALTLVSGSTGAWISADGVHWRSLPPTG